MTIPLLGALIFILLLILYRAVREIKKLEAHINALNLIIDSACNIDHKSSNQLSKGGVQINKRSSTRGSGYISGYAYDDHYRGSSSRDSYYDATRDSSYDSSSSISSSSNDTDYSGDGGSFSGSGSSGSWD